MTAFFVRDQRNVDYDPGFSAVTRSVYKKMAKINDEAGFPIQVGTEYRRGAPCKFLTVKSKEVSHGT